MKKAIHRSVLVILCAVATLSTASAGSSESDPTAKRQGALFTASILPFVDIKKNSNTLLLLSELKGAYYFTISASTFFIGGSFEQERYDFLGDIEEQRISIGATVGWLVDQWQFNLTVLPFSRYTGEEYEFDNGMGIRGDFAYRWPISKGVSAGPQLGFRYIRYRNGDFVGSGAVTPEPKNQFNFIPMFSSEFRF